MNTVTRRRERRDWHQEDRTCTHRECAEFGTHRVITQVHGETEPILEWMCAEHSLDCVVTIRLFCDEATSTRSAVAR